MALNSLVMKVNNLIERKNTREAIRAGKTIAPKNDSSNSRFARGSSAHSHHVSKKNAKKGRESKNQTGLNILDSMDENLDFDEHEMQERQNLKEIDSMYLINQEEDDELFIFRGIGKVKQKQNAETFPNMISPYIPVSNRNDDSLTNSQDQVFQDLENSNMPVRRDSNDDELETERQQVPVDEGLY